MPNSSHYLLPQLNREHTRGKLANTLTPLLGFKLKDKTKLISYTKKLWSLKGNQNPSPNHGQLYKGPKKLKSLNILSSKKSVT